jgi:hypothetical protein
LVLEDLEALGVRLLLEVLLLPSHLVDLWHRLSLGDLVLRLRLEGRLILEVLLLPSHLVDLWHRLSLGDLVGRLILAVR